MPSTRNNLPDFRPAPLGVHDRLLDVISVLGVGVAAAAVGLFWSHLPGSVPRHFNAAGKPDSWGSPDLLVWLVALAALLHVGLGLILRFPRLINYPFQITAENVARQYALARTMVLALRAEVVWLFAYITLGTIYTSLGRASGLGSAFLPVTLGAVFGTLAVYLLAAFRAR